MKEIYNFKDETFDYLIWLNLKINLRKKFSNKAFIQSGYYDSDHNLICSGIINYYQYPGYFLIFLKKASDHFEEMIYSYNICMHVCSYKESNID